MSWPHQQQQQQQQWPQQQQQQPGMWGQQQQQPQPAAWPQQQQQQWPAQPTQWPQQQQQQPQAGAWPLQQQPVAAWPQQQQQPQAAAWPQQQQQPAAWPAQPQQPQQWPPQQAQQQSTAVPGQPWPAPSQAQAAPATWPPAGTAQPQQWPAQPVAQQPAQAPPVAWPPAGTSPAPVAQQSPVTAQQPQGTPNVAAAAPAVAPAAPAAPVAIDVPTGPVAVVPETLAAIKSLNDGKFPEAKARLERLLGPSGDPAWGPAMLLLRELRMAFPSAFVPDPADTLKSAVTTLSPAAKQRTEAFLGGEALQAGGYGILAAAVFENMKGDAESTKKAASLYRRASEPANGSNARALCYLAYFTQYGLGNEPKDDAVALQLYTQAAAQGDILAVQCKAQLEQAAQAQKAQSEAQLVEQRKREAQQNPGLERVAREALGAMDGKAWATARQALDKSPDKMFIPLVILQRELWLAYPKAFGSPMCDCFPTPEVSLRRSIELTPENQRDRCWRFIEGLMMPTSGQRVSPNSYLLAAVWKDLVEEDLEERVRLLRIAADLGVPRAQHYLSQCLLSGNGVPAADPAEAAKMLEAAVQSGDAAAIMSKAHGTNVGLLEKAVQAGVQEAKARLLMVSSRHRGATISAAEEKLIDKVKELSGARNLGMEAEAEKATKVAITALARLDFPRAVECSLRACKIDRTFGVAAVVARQVRYTCPQLYTDPDRTAVKEAECSSCDKVQKERGNAFVDMLVMLKPQCDVAHLVAGMWYLVSSPGKPPAKNPHQLLKNCADKFKNARAQVGTGLLLLGYYDTTPPIARDHPAGVAYLRAAAEKGDMCARYYLGCCLAGVEIDAILLERDLPAAAALFRQSAEQGHAPAMYQLGLALTYSKGVPQDWPEARSWLEKSVAGEYKHAPEALAVVVELLRNREQENLLREAVAKLDTGTGMKEALDLVEKCLGLWEHYVPARLLRREIHLAAPKLLLPEQPADQKAYKSQLAAGFEATKEFAARTWTFLTEGLLANSPFTKLLCALWKRDVEVDADMAVKLLHESVQLSCSRARVNLALHEEEKDPEKAVGLLRDASGVDDGQAHWVLGDMLAHARGVPKEDLGEARRLYVRANDAGYNALAAQRTMRLDAETHTRSALAAFDAREYAAAKNACAEALNLCRGFAPAWLLMTELRRAAPSLYVGEPLDPKDLHHGTCLAALDAETKAWSQAFVRHVLSDPRTVFSIGLVVAGLFEEQQALRGRSISLPLYARGCEHGAKTCARAYFWHGLMRLEDANDPDVATAVELLRTAAQKLDDLEAQLLLARCFLGLGPHADRVTQRDRAGAMQLLRSAAGRELPEAQLQLGLCLYEDLKVPECAAEAAKLFRLAAVQRNSEAQYMLAVCLRDATGVVEDWPEALTWFESCVNLGFETKGKPALKLHIEAMRNREQERLLELAARAFSEQASLDDVVLNMNASVELFPGFVPGLMMQEQVYLHLPCRVPSGSSLARRIAAALQALSEEHKARSAAFMARIAASGTPTAAAGLLLQGVWLARADNDAAGAARCYAASLTTGARPLPRAQCAMAECLANSWGVPPDLREAARLYGAAAQAHDAAAQYLLSCCIRDGVGVEIPSAEAAQQETVRLLRGASDSGYHPAQYQLGMMYLSGSSGVVLDLTQAATLFIAAAEQGNPDAAWEAAQCLTNGRGVPSPNLPQAAKFLTVASSQGHSRAQHRLGNCYQHGMGVRYDEDMAATLYQQAIAGGVVEARADLAALEAEIRARQVAWAQQEAARAQERAAEEAQRTSEKLARLLR